MTPSFAHKKMQLLLYRNVEKNRVHVQYKERRALRASVIASCFFLFVSRGDKMLRTGRWPHRRQPDVKGEGRHSNTAITPMRPWILRCFGILLSGQDQDVRKKKHDEGRAVVSVKV